MHKYNHESESGQVLVLVVLAVITLLGFTALAVDGGMVYSDRRFAQNGADSASIGAAGVVALFLENENVTWENWDCDNGSIAGKIALAVDLAETTAIDRAETNNFAIDDDITDNHGVVATCGVDSGTFEDKYIDIRVLITAETRPAFAQFVYKGPLVNTVEAITRVRPRTPIGYGRAIVSLNPNACSGNNFGMIYNGDIEVNVNGGGVFSNGCLVGDGNSLNVDVLGGGIQYVEELDTNHIGTFSPQPLQVGDLVPTSSYNVDAPDCDQVPYFNSPSTAYAVNGGGEVPPGNYSRFNFNRDVVLTGGGLYCMYGNFDAGNVNITIDHPFEGVTIYLITGDFRTSGNGLVQLYAPPAYPDPYPALPGILIYLAPGNTGEVILQGNADSVFSGTILAPTGDIHVSGNPSMSTPVNFFTQLIGYNVFVEGSTFVNIYYDPNNPSMRNAFLDLLK